MAAPPSKTIKNLNGKWIMNTNLSGDVDGMLAMQGVSWLMRSAISLATITLSVTEEVGPPTKIKIEQTATGGIKGTTEKRTLDWVPHQHKDYIFGEVEGCSRWIKLADLEPGKGLEEKDFLASGWEDPTQEFVQSWVANEQGGWTANQIWGFEVIEGTRYWVRHVVVKKGDEIKMEKLVYDWQGEE